MFPKLGKEMVQMIWKQKNSLFPARINRKTKSFTDEPTGRRAQSLIETPYEVVNNGARTFIGNTILLINIATTFHAFFHVFLNQL